MNIIAVDDEYLPLIDLEYTINEAAPNASVVRFESSSEAAQYGSENHIDIAFLDINMPGSSGIELAKMLKETNPAINIIFTTGYDEYALEAFSVQASDYLTKPITVEAVTKTLRHLRTPVEPVAEIKLRIQCFGNFDVFINGKPVYFQRQKAKELLAYLVHKRGTSCTVKEICAAIYDENEDISSPDKQIQTVMSSMMKTLRESDVEDIVIKNYNSISIDVTKVDCDFYRYLEKDPTLVSVYTGEYMTNYAWAEFRPEFLGAMLTNR